MYAIQEGIENVKVDSIEFISKLQTIEQEQAALDVKPAIGSPKATFRKFAAENQPYRILANAQQPIALNKGNPCKIKSLGERDIAYDSTIILMELEDGSQYVFTDLWWWNQIEKTPLRAGTTVFVYPMLPEEVYYQHRYHNATHWLENENGERWRVGRAWKKL